MTGIATEKTPFYYGRYYLKTIIPAITCMMLSSACLLALGKSASRITNGESPQIEDLALLVGLAAFSACRYYLTTTTAKNIANTIRQDCFEAILNGGPFARPHQKPNTLITTISADIDAIEENIGSTIPSLIRQGLQASGALVLLLWSSPALTIVFLLAIPITIIPTIFLKPKIRRKAAEATAFASTALSYAIERITHVRVVQAWNQQKPDSETFRTLCEKTAQATRERALLRAGSIAITILASGAAIIIVSVVTTILNRKHITDSGTIANGLFYALICANSITSAIDSSSELSHTAARWDRIKKILGTENPIASNEGTDQNLKTADWPPTIELQNICHAYDDGTPSLKNINLTIRPGEHVVITGPSGGGKSTLTAIITQELKPTSGRILIDGIDVDTMDPAKTRDLFARVFQSPDLFDDTLLNNLRYSHRDNNVSPNEPTSSEQDAIFLAGAEPIAQSLPEGYLTRLGPNGNRLSGGQKQRIAIARAIASERPIMILDEPNSALDMENEKILARSIRTILRGRTVLTVSHRPAIIETATRTVVLENGRIQEIETPCAIRKTAAS